MKGEGKRDMGKEIWEKKSFEYHFFLLPSDVCLLLSAICLLLSVY